METLCLKKDLPIFFQLESFADKQFSIPTHYITHYTYARQYVFQIIFKPTGLDQMKMGWIFNNSAGKKHI